MKYKILPLCGLALALLSATGAEAQNKAYAVTGETAGKFNWNAIREIDLSTGEVLRTIYDPSKIAGTTIRTIDGMELEKNNLHVTSNGVAAAAFDKKSNRIYFTQMRGNNLNYIDLNTENVVVVNADSRFNTGLKNTEANVITRMCIGADGFGYALTNDANQLIRFSTGTNSEVQKLGQITDAKTNGNVSIHNQCSGWGGDMIADAYGNLWVFSMSNNIFKINPKTLVAEHMGVIKGLAAGFNTNGAAVNDDGAVILSSAVLHNHYYKLNLSTFTATPLPNTKGVMNASDLASANLAYSSKQTQQQTPLLEQLRGNQFISIYPNPVTNHQLKLSLNKLPAGKYTVELSDLSGKRVQTHVMETSGTETRGFAVDAATAKGIYVLKVVNAEGTQVFTEKFILQ